MTTDYKIKVTPRRSIKRGAYLDIVDGTTNKPVAYICQKERYISDTIPQAQRAEILTIFDNYETISELYGDSAALLKLNYRISQELKDSLLNTYKITEALNIDFKPMRAMTRALIKEITRALHQAGIESDLPQLEDHYVPSKHIQGRRIFQELLEIKGEGAVETYRSIASASFNRNPEDIEVKHLHMYAEGKAKPAYWAYSSALEAFASLGKNIFEIKLDAKYLFEFWSTYYLKAQYDKEKIIEIFRKKFKPDEAKFAQFKDFLNN